jgi:hypothetical protein
MTQTRQFKTTRRGVRLEEFDDLIERKGLSPSGVLKLAVRRLAQAELQNKAASQGIEIQKEAA